MNQIIKYVPLALLLLFISACNSTKIVQNKEVKIAFLSDVHLLDIYGEFSDFNYRGVLNPMTNKYTLARTMQSQLQSTRLFNENYFAFIAALDDVAKRKIKYVALPGDFTDDGQPLNIRGIKNILNNYSNKFGIQFFITTGNHDVVRPFLMDGGKKDFLGEGGKQQVIMSKEGLYSPKESSELPIVVTKDIGRLGYNEVLSELKDFGFTPKQSDVYWETPFSSYNYSEYNYKKATQAALIDNRKYTIPPFGSPIPDLSYLVEPVDGLWLLAIDANVYIPKQKAKDDPNNPDNYDSPNVGYNHVLTHKEHLIKWIEKITKEADSRGKTLITFSHYPMVDYNDDATVAIENLFGEDKMQLHRVPDENVAQIFAEAGIKIHFGGHMHINDTGVRTYENGKSLVNIQVSSLAAYIPAYKLLTVKSNQLMEIETIVIDSVANFKELFPLYKQEHDYLVKTGNSTIWNEDVLNSKTYKEYTQWHLKELVRLRFLKEDWPLEFKDSLLEASGKDLLFLFDQNLNGELLPDNIALTDFEQWTGFDMIYDYYRLKSADELAINDIGIARLEQYKLVCKQFEKSANTNFKLWAEIFEKTCNGAPSNHFVIDLKLNTIDRITH
ncbi:metallophosphoesterase family protein [Flavobacterium algicola]|uniref:metallophosphoesterase family protein n=1 Tax=Flavobacterium algicola TaxID=556529 RepID=UPI001EFEDEDA|nr:metallophosphoesterase [Flavobacterium algicola]MCG9793170.1 metallophosphoesterase [Flavobacterium algicola]